MTGCLTTKTMPSGKEYYYIVLKYKDPETLKWRSKWVSTGLTTKNNKKKARSMIDNEIKRYAYLEKRYFGIDQNPTMSEYLDHWVQDRKTVVKEATMMAIYIG